MTRIEQSIEINVPVSTAYRQLTQFEQYPRFMEDVEEVRQLDDTHLHWHTKAGNLDMEWDAEITQQVPDRCIAWRNINGPRYEGRIELRPTEGDRTEVKLTMECDPKQQVLAQHGDAQKAIAERTEHDLARFKKFIEKLGRESHDWLGKIKDTQPLTTDAGAARMAHDEQEGRELSRRAPAGDGRVPSSVTDAWTASMRPGWMPDMMQAWSDPLTLMRRMTEDVDRLIGRVVGGLSGAVPSPAPAVTAPGSAWTPPVEVAQRDGKFIVCAELAGVKREDVKVEVSGDRLTIEGERRQEPPHGPQDFRRSERAYGRFYRVLTLPPGAQGEAASASLQDGLLEVTVPVGEAARQRRRIEIEARR